MTKINPVASNIKPFDKKAPAERKPPKKITADYLHNSGLYYLQRFAASSTHFRRVMIRKVDKSCAAHPNQDREQCISLVDSLIEKFQRVGLLDDTAYAAGAVTSLRRRGLSTRAIEGRMTAKGLNRDQVRNALDTTDEHTGPDADLHAALRLARRKRIGPFSVQTAVPPDAKNDKSMAILGRAGFDYETARRALACAPADALEILDRVHQ